MERAAGASARVCAGPVVRPASQEHRADGPGGPGHASDVAELRVVSAVGRAASAGPDPVDRGAGSCASSGDWGSSTRAATPRRARTPPGSNGNGAATRASGTIAWWGFIWAMSRATSSACWIAICICRRTGSKTPFDGKRPGFPRRWSFAPSPPSRWSRSAARYAMGFGSRPGRSMSSMGGARSSWTVCRSWAELRGRDSV